MNRITTEVIHEVLTKKHRCLLAPYSRQASGEYMPTLTDACVVFHGIDGNGGRVGATDLPADYRYITLRNSPVRENQPQVYKLLDAYVTTFERQFDADTERIKSLYFYSKNPGTGKTTSAAALLNEYLVAHFLGSLKRKRQPLQQPAYFLDVNEFQATYNLATMTKDEPELERIKRLIVRCQRVPFLVMDDIGVRGATEAFRGYLHTIINYRCANGLPTVYTANFPLEEISKLFDDRLYDRMRDMCVEVRFSGESQRGRR